MLWEKYGNQVPHHINVDNMFKAAAANKKSGPEVMALLLDRYTVAQAATNNDAEMRFEVSEVLLRAAVTNADQKDSNFERLLAPGRGTVPNHRTGKACMVPIRSGSEWHAVLVHQRHLGSQRINALQQKGSTALEVKLAETLSEYVQPQSQVSLHDTAHSILAQLPADKPYSDEGYALACLVHEVAVQIPYQHPSHARLVRLLKHLTRSPKVRSPSTVEGEEDLCVNFQALGPKAYEKPLEWVNYHAFLAQLDAAGVWTTGMPNFAVWEMRDAFEEEEEEPDAEGQQLHQYHVMAAAQWILWDGQKIFKYMANPLPVREDEARMWRLGDRCSSSDVAVVSVARWQLWKEGFRAAAASAEGAEGTDECKDLAGRASALMDAIEKSMSF
ncbi:hypothetical protein DHEL01_v210849 [Diaporthe helianthi]|uniref:Uncharacterized protein n=1 Tax=Diaporthe helianthi TaxID=158607 RepID=A0A2P5HKG5_DIAHE|nr:hypothetical protein DHEL01_v210849 [Diaporthe helianthi]